MDIQERVLSLADQERDYLVGFLQDLVRVRSIWGDAAALSRAAALVHSALRVVDIEANLVDSGTIGMPMVLGRLVGSGRGPSLLLDGHLDVYPPSTSWSKDPFGAEIDGGRLFGQGVADMKGGTAAMTMAAVILAKSGVRLAGDLVVLAIPNHFEGGEGSRVALRRGLTVDYAVTCEPTDLQIVTGQRGILYVTITVKGRSAHTTAAGVGVNAIVRAAQVIEALQSVVPRNRARQPVGEPLILNVAMISGGLAHNLIPETCTLTVDIRFPPGQTAADALQDVKDAIEGAVSDEFVTEAAPEDTCVRNPRNSAQIANDHPLTLALLEAHRAASGRKARVGFHKAWPDAPIFVEAGIPAISYGPGSMDAYWDDEFVEVADYLTAVKTYCLAALSIVGTAGD
jgi:acetylornithine deacetylase/succinyl-diaminopimelate desuccinylase-like protein